MSLPSSKIHKSWEPILLPLFEDERWGKLKRFLKTKPFFTPRSKDIFNAFDIELHRLRVVIVGQDPYPNEFDAHGIAFSIPDNGRRYEQWPPSLQVIAKDICQTEDEDYIYKWFDPNLNTWMAQGVLLLNRALTTSRGESHQYQWSWFTSHIIKQLNELDQSIIFYFLGSPAKEYKELITSEAHHYTFESIHPAALAYNVSLEFDGKFNDIAKLYHQIHGFELHYTLPF